MVTRVLVGINVLAYLWEVATGALTSNESLINAGAMYGPLIAQGQWWRIVTGSFLHGGFLHILFNMLALWQIGTITEQIYGSPRFLLLYAISLAGGGWTIYTFTYNEVTIGASGAIFGIFGALTAAGVRMGRRGRPLVTSNIGIIIVNLVLGFTLPNISNAGHLGGLACGFVAGYVLLPRQWVYRQTQSVRAERADPNTIEGEVLYDSAHPPASSPHDASRESGERPE